MRSLGRPLAAICLALGATACERTPVIWSGDPAPLGGTFTDASVLALRGVPDDVRVVPHAVALPERGLPVLPRGSCLISLRWARASLGASSGASSSAPSGARSGELAAAWWAARADSSVVLYLARSIDDGAHWDSTRAADTRDPGVRGCARPAPAVATDPLGGYTHLVYFLEPASGAGVFYEHLMDLPVAPTAHAPATGITATGIAMFHAPVAIVYGERPGPASVTGHGDTVVVAYQDPNRAAPQVALAVSVTGGHTFAPRVPASGDNVEARDPAIGIDGSTVAVAWRESAIRSDGASDTAAAARAVVRVGRFR